MGLVNNDIVQVQFRGLCFGQRIIMVHNYVILGDWSPGTSVAQDLAVFNNAVAAGGILNIETAYLACLPPQYSLTEIRSQRIRLTRSAYVSLGLNQPGTHASPATVANDSAALTMRTALAGRKQVATQHIGPVPDAVSAAGLLIAGYKVLLTALGTKLVQSFVPPGSGVIASPIVLHRSTWTWDLINSFIIGDQSRVQRRRTVGVGE